MTSRPEAFDSELHIVAAEPRTWALTEPLAWMGTRGDRFVVPAGFVTDFATVPRFLHWLVSPYGAYTRAAVLHDWLLVSLTDWQTNWAGGDQPFPGNPIGANLPMATSRDCDGIFRRVMEDLGVDWATRWAMWTAVRWASLFNRDRAYGRRIGRDLPAMLGMSALVMPFVFPGSIVVLLTLILLAVVDGTATRVRWIFRVFFRRDPAATSGGEREA